MKKGKCMSITNENRDKDLKEWIYQWLKEE